MYFKSLKIKNYGPLTDADITFGFNADGKPKPIVFIGKNGSGKSLLLTNLVDALVEVKRNAFPGGIIEVNDRSYYKVGKKSYIKNGENFSFIEITLENNNEKSSSVDIMVKNVELLKENNNDIFIKYFQNNENGGYYKNTSSTIKADGFINSSISYFPIDRFYLPSWYNLNNYNKINTQNFEHNINTSSNNFIKYNISENIKEWLYRVFLERNEVGTYLPDNRIRFLKIGSAIQEKINKILKIVLNDTEAYVGAISRFSTSIPIMTKNGKINDISMLSSGEMMMLSIFLSIIKDFDESRHLGNTKEIVDGICLIDEIDLNTHISQQINALPKLIREFPYIQFVMTTHSPFFIKGFKDEFISDCDIYSLTNSKKIDSIYDFSQFEEAEAAFNDSIDELKERLDKQEKQIEELTKNNSKILFITEGITDTKYVFNAVDKNSYAFSKVLTRANDDLNSLGDTQLIDYLNVLSKLGDSSPRLLALFDSDNKSVVKMFKGSLSYTFLEKRIYGLLLPKPSFRSGGTEFSIEHYFTDEDLSIKDGNFKLYCVKEFGENGVTTDCTKICRYLVHNRHRHEEHYILDGSGEQKTLLLSDSSNVSLSKNDYCDLAIKGNGDFSKIDWTHFVQLLDFINSYLNLFDI